MKLSFNLIKWMAFIATLLLSYAASQGIANKYFLIDYYKQTWRTNIQNIFMMVVLATIVFVFGNYNNTFPNIASISLIFIVPLILNMIETKFNSTTQQIHTINQWDNNQRKIFTAIIIISLLFLLGNTWVAKRNRVLYQYLFYMLIVLFTIIILFITSHTPDQYKKSFHLHYWLIGWILALFTRFKDSTWSEIGAGFALGLFVHGFSIYKDNLSFYDCNDKTYIRNNGEYLQCIGQENYDVNKDYNDANWYSIMIVSLVILIFVGMKYMKKRK
jgi:hypothetical protein